VTGESGWAEVFEGPRMKAEIVRAALSAAGFHVEELGGMPQFAELDFDTGRLYVPDSEAQAARELIERAEAT
jgi:hypothetical protein